MEGMVRWDEADDEVVRRGEECWGGGWIVLEETAGGRFIIPNS